MNPNYTDIFGRLDQLTKKLRATSAKVASLQKESTSDVSTFVFNGFEQSVLTITEPISKTYLLNALTPPTELVAYSVFLDFNPCPTVDFKIEFLVLGIATPIQFNTSLECLVEGSTNISNSGINTVRYNAAQGTFYTDF